MSVGSRWTAVWCTLGALGVFWVLGVAMLLQTSYDTAMGVTLFHVVGGSGAVLTWLVARRTETTGITRIIVAGWFAKLMGTLARFYVLQILYDGTGDANRYSSVGASVAEMLRSGEVAWHRPGARVVGTAFVEYVTGVVFTVTGPSTLGGFVVFSALGFVGTFLLYRAACIAAPQVDARMFALLLFFLPSMVFWPSSLGKETLMLLAIGLFTYGSAAILTHRAGQGIPALAAGTALSAMVRPHITLMLVASLLLATVVTRSRSAGEEVPIGKFVKVLLAAVLLVWAAVAAGSFLEVDLFDQGGVSTALEATGEQTDTGGSAFSHVNPALFPWAVVTVLFRPFPFEAGNLQAAIASAEGMFLLGLVFHRRQALWASIRSVRASGLLAMALVFTVVFVYAYTGFNNFGLLARQRSQVYPFLLMLLAVPTVTRRAISPIDRLGSSGAPEARRSSPGEHVEPVTGGVAAVEVRTPIPRSITGERRHRAAVSPSQAIQPRPLRGPRHE